MKLRDFSFKTLGESMDKDLQDFRRVLNLGDEKENCNVMTMGDVVRELLRNVGKDVVLKTIDTDFEYNDLVNWVKANAVGNKFYVVKTTLENSSDDVLCVFFGKDDSFLVEKDYPKICYVFKNLNPSLEDLFANGNEIYVKSIKYQK